MNGLQFQQLPAARVNEVRGRLHSQWKIEADALNKSWFSDRGKFDTALAKLNAKYQKLEFDSLTELQQQQQEQQRVQELIRQPRNMGRVEEAGLRMELGPEAERLVFPPELRPLSIEQLYSERLMGSIQDFAEAAPTTPEFWTRAEKEPKTKGGIINQYLQWRELIQYDARNPRVQQQLDMQWDAFMMGNEKYNEWWLDKKKRQPTVEIKALRTPGEMGKIMKDRIMGAGGITPIGRSIIKKEPVRWEQPIEVASWLTSKLREPEPAASAETLRRRGTKEAYEEGVKLGYWKS